MTFRFTVKPDGPSLTAKAVTIRPDTDRAQPVVAIHTSPGRKGPSPTLYVPLDRIDELLDGIRDIARQAAESAN
ncbi:hypothetical protein PV749_10550 [Streptomyces sp. ID03-2B]|uniref:hypothetical protein n=1 Tax=Streptomyces sp. ID03-2B TaxID=3028660 RepID=UPI0029A832C2|nr:hypothetical protein [Streptomyces sp. ID03-2B]MDX3591563.1 hypothetical protein [Streptomyces sp. ID03-2B]